MDLLLLLFLLCVSKLDHHGRAAPLHGEGVVHGLDSNNGHLAVAEGYKGTAYKKEDSKPLGVRHLHTSANPIIIPQYSAFFYGTKLYEHVLDIFFIKLLAHHPDK